MQYSFYKKLIIIQYVQILQFWLPNPGGFVAVLRYRVTIESIPKRQFWGSELNGQL